MRVPQNDARWNNMWSCFVHFDWTEDRGGYSIELLMQKAIVSYSKWVRVFFYSSKIVVQYYDSSAKRNNVLRIRMFVMILTYPVIFVEKWKCFCIELRKQNLFEIKDLESRCIFIMWSQIPVHFFEKHVCVPHALFYILCVWLVNSFQ